MTTPRCHLFLPHWLSSVQLATSTMEGRWFTDEWVWKRSGSSEYVSGVPSTPSHLHPLDLNAAGVLRLRSVRLHLQLCAGREKNPVNCHNVCSALSQSLKRPAISNASQFQAFLLHILCVCVCPSRLSIERRFISSL